ncbi:TPA: UDP-diphosphatase [Patescibacteria group bacterium]|nr:UDP-diphosphatase [Patescibacteria group bacterium]
MNEIASSVTSFLSRNDTIAMIELFKAILLGAVQGITEFLPVSSTGHLILFERLLGVSQETYGLTFDAALHLGTLVAVLWFFKKEWKQLFRASYSVILNLFQDLINKKLKFSTDSRRSLSRASTRGGNDKLVVILLVGTFPAVLFGLLLEDLVNTALRAPILIAAALILFSFVLIYVELASWKIKLISQLKFLDGLIIGTAQAVAFIPGVSRSGITMAAGLWRGLTREQSARFAFLLSAPIIAGAGGKKLWDIIKLTLSGQLTTSEQLFFIVGMVSAACFGYLTIKYFLKFISKHTLWPFIAYRIMLGLFIIILSLSGLTG